MSHRAVFLSAIHTDSGKTQTALWLCQALGCHYWKPVQAGQPHDRDRLAYWLSNPQCKLYPERHVLQHPLSPHRAAALEGVKMQMTDFALPTREDPLLVEGAGGLLSPITPEAGNIHLARHLGLPVVLVVNFYLGSLNHTLLSLAYLQQQDLVEVKGLVFFGASEYETFVAERSPWPVLARIPEKKWASPETFWSDTELWKAEMDYESLAKNLFGEA